MSLSAIASPPLGNTLIARFFPSMMKLSAFKYIILTLVGTMLLTLSAKISIPFYPVPTTLQTFAVVMLGCVFGSRLAAATTTLYLFEGLIGLPVFQGSTAGLIYMTGPTAGYLVGFVSAAYVTGRLFEEGFGRSVISAALLFTLGAVIIDISGALWLSKLIGFDLTKTIYLNYQYAFLLKTGLGAIIVPALWHHHHREKKKS